LIDPFDDLLIDITLRRIPMKNRQIPIPVLIIVVVLILAGAYYLLTDRTSITDTSLTASGTIETTDITISSEISGRITEVLVDEGVSVKQGQPLIQLDRSILEAHRELTLAADQAAVAAADLELVNAQQALNALNDNAPMITAQAGLAMANAAKALDDEQYRWRVQQKGNRASPETVREGEAKLKLAEDEVSRLRGLYNRASGDSAKALALVKLTQAERNRDAALRNLNWYKGTPTDEDQAILDAKLAIVQAQLDDARRIWEQVKDGPNADDVTAAQARLTLAQAHLAAAKAQSKVDAETLNLQLDKLTVVAPADGIILSRLVQPGEVVAPGGKALELGLLGDMTITVYIPEDRYGDISLGQKAEVKVDSFPGEIFNAVVTHIADSAQFTPRNVQTAEGRSTTVYAIKLMLEDPGGKLKPGMPADVSFR
jgi:HlyD family secretion protein